MAFNYEGLKRIHELDKPYRGTNNYAYYDRNHRHKYFIPVEVNGETEYHMHYYWVWKEEYMSVADYEQAKEHMSKRELDKWHQYTLDNDVVIPYWRKWYKADKPYGIIRSDNTIEFVTDDFHQGLRMHLTDLTQKVFMQDCKSGGTIITNHWYAPRQSFKRPVFMNMRISLDTFEPHESSRYTIDIKSLDRKKSNQLFKSHDDKFKLSETFYKTMDEKAFLDDVKELINHHLPDGWDNESLKALSVKANAIWDTNPIESSLLNMIANGVYNILWTSRNDRLWYEPIKYFHKFKRIYKKHLQINNDVFNKQRFWDFDAYYPASNWAMELRDTNGNLLTQV